MGGDSVSQLEAPLGPGLGVEVVVMVGTTVWPEPEDVAELLKIKPTELLAMVLARP